ncbi:hypothetical protein ILUMI_21106 [Ignelater luminosus]|uniref:CID domain-containing protein n=1 Tax=Ignelater luminosus TaxID=2038154 RepID=A0A8K0CG68_IGNLU|nr:hypothetical protein ILUMI_21106 [Ignelater luminosus]
MNSVKSTMAGSSEIKEEYTSSLADLTFNSKPLISVLTMLAEEYIAQAKDIVEAIETHLSRVRTEVKLPVLYLIDSIIKNLGGPYTSLFCQNIVSTFCNVFKEVDERTRAEMFRLRQTWNDVIPAKKLYALDIQIKQLDPAWPVTAPPPNHIHFNPKFFKPTTTSALGNLTTTTTTSSVSKVTAPLIPTANADLDEKTISMQQKLINKQRELLELQQRKLELELLQTQVKLQEQLKNKLPVTTTTTNATSTTSSLPMSTSAQNLLLKPEVAKQLSTTSTTSKTTSNTTNTKPKTGTHSVSSVLNAKLQQNTSSNATPRIAPVQSNLANARPIRDPRLLRHHQQQQQQQQQQQLQQAQQNSKTNTNNANVHLETKSKSLVNNKGNIESHGKSKTLPHSSPLKHTQKIGSSPRKTGKFSRDSKSTLAIASSDSAASVATISKSTSSSSLSSSSKSNNKSDTSTKNRLPSKSSIKIKKKGSSMRSDAVNRTESDTASADKDNILLRFDKGTSSGASFRSDKDNSALMRIDKKSDNKHCNNKISKSENKDKLRISKSEIMTTSFKELKGSTKNRNYMRRNRNASVSPEPNNQDVDLRLGAPPEKQPRLQGDISDDKHTIIVDGTTDNPPNKDVDLRQLPSVIGKKRPSTETRDSPNAKKSKTEMFDVLFGREDIDLRQLPPAVMSSPKGADRPPTPPPPIISENKHTPTNRHSEAPIDKIIISPADEECIKAGNMTKAQETALMNKIIAQIETQKLREAKRKESESATNQSISISLQPISDDEFEADFSSNETENEGHKRIASPSDDKGNRVLREDQTKEEPYKENRVREREDRIMPPQNVIPPEETYAKFPRIMEHRDPRANRPWRGRHRQKGWDNMLSGPMLRPGMRPPIRPPGPEPWMRPMNETWRGMGPPGPPLYHNNFGPEQMIPNIPPHMLEQGSHSPNSSNHEVPALEYAPPNSFKFITIDGEAREIRYYDETAIVFMSAGDPREITFHNGVRRIFFDGEPHTLKFNHPYEEISIKGTIHKVRLGAPSREIFIDGKGYQCYFDQNEKTIELDGNTIMVKLEPPPPHVKIGQEKRLDLVAGKIQLVVDAKNMFTIFLDAKPQKFQIDGVEHTLKFVDALRAVLINDVRFEVEFGGLPKPVMLHEVKHFIRFSVLPKGIKPGHVRIKDMEVCQPFESPKNDNENSQDGFSTQMFTATDSLLPISNNAKKSLGCDSPDRNSNSPHHFQNLIHQQNFNNLDMLSSVLSSSMIASSTEGGYKVESGNTPDMHQEIQPSNSISLPSMPTQETTTQSNFNINELFQRLVATGIVTTAAASVQPIEQQLPPFSPSKTARNTNNFKQIKPVDFTKPETLKIRRQPLIQSLHLGMQCSSCGMRFPPEQSMYYSQHLDWHFRQNRRGKKNIRKASSRRWYYTFSDWKNYEELEDLEEREKSYFENQQQNQNEGANEEGEEEIEIPCVPADPNVQNAICEVCQDRFEQFYNEEKDEWQLRMAVRVDDKTYHPLCYEDYQASLVDVTLDESRLNNVPEPESNSNSGIPLLEVPNEESSNKEEEKVENDEDDVMEVIDNIDDDEVPAKESDQQEEPKIDDNEADEDDDDDVIINEVIPEKIVLDDDDKDDYVPPEDDDGLIPGVVVKEEPIDDGFVDVGNGVLKMKTDIVKIKTEPVDNDEPEPDILPPDSADTTHIEVVSSIDGNVELDSGVPTSSGISNKIKINITKPLPTVVPKESRDIISEELKTDCIDPSQPLPPGEEPVQLHVKPALKGLELKRQPTVKKGSELTGLCSIM